MLFFCVFNLVVADAVKTLNKHHDSRYTNPRWFRCIMQWARRQTVALTASLYNLLVAELNQIFIEQDRLDLPKPCPINCDIRGLSEILTGLFRLGKHRGER